MKGIILAGGSVDIRTEEEKFQDALEAALPEGGEAFTKLVLLVKLDGIDAVYTAGAVDETALIMVKTPFY